MANQRLRTLLIVGIVLGLGGVAFIVGAQIRYSLIGETSEASRASSSSSSVGYPGPNPFVLRNQVCGNQTYVYVSGQGGPVYSVTTTCQTLTTMSLGNLTFVLGGNSLYTLPQALPVYLSQVSGLKGSYGYSLLDYKDDPSDPTYQFVILNVTESEVVAGNWSTGYHVTYVNNELMNVSFLVTGQSSYWIKHVATYHLPDQNYALSYDSQQQEYIRAALSNGTVQHLENGSEYYVAKVDPGGTCGPANAYGSGLWASLYQVNGPKEVDVNLACGTMRVIAVEEGTAQFGDSFLLSQ